MAAILVDTHHWFTLAGRAGRLADRLRCFTSDPAAARKAQQTAASSFRSLAGGCGTPAAGLHPLRGGHPHALSALISAS